MLPAGFERKQLFVYTRRPLCWPRGVQSGRPPAVPERGKLLSKTGVTKNGPSNVAPPSRDRTTRYWFSSGVLKLSNATYRCPVLGLTVGDEYWLSSHPVSLAKANVQKDALPLIVRRGDHER